MNVSSLTSGAPAIGRDTLNGSSATTSASNAEGTFLKLLVTQLKTQDPTSPMDPTQMVNQMLSMNQLDQLIQIHQLLQVSSPGNQTQTGAH